MQQQLQPKFSNRNKENVPNLRLVLESLLKMTKKIHRVFIYVFQLELQLPDYKIEVQREIKRNYSQGVIFDEE